MARAFKPKQEPGQYVNPYDDGSETFQSTLPTPPLLDSRPNSLTLEPPPVLNRDRRGNLTGMLLATLGGLLGGNREAAAGLGAAYGQGFTGGEDARQRRDVDRWQRQQQQAAMINADKWRQFESANRQAVLEWQMQNQAAANLRGEEARAERDKRQTIEDTRYEEGLKREAGNTWYNRWRDAMESKRRNEQDAERGGGRKIGLRVQYLRDVLRDQTATPEERQGALSELRSLFGGTAPGATPAPVAGVQKPAFLPMSPAASANIKMGQDRLKQGSDRMKQSASQFAQRLQFQGAQGAANRAVRLQTAPKPKSDKLTQSQSLSLAARYDGMAGDFSKSPEERAKAAAMAKSLREKSGVKMPKALGDMNEGELRAALRASGGDVAPRTAPTRPTPKKATAAPPAKPTKRTFTPPKPRESKPAPKGKSVKEKTTQELLKQMMGGG